MMGLRSLSRSFRGQDPKPSGPGPAFPAVGRAAAGPGELELDEALLTLTFLTPPPPAGASGCQGVPRWPTTSPNCLDRNEKKQSQQLFPLL
mmetsp:Transcript_1514/g.2531  ORF Transcript_1514/g.2531 Transcript_1514/m.2531 type:complete len:91 (+) Transcript_1514:6-278(+)